MLDGFVDYGVYDKLTLLVGHFRELVVGDYMAGDIQRLSGRRSFHAIVLWEAGGVLEVRRRKVMEDGFR